MIHYIAGVERDVSMSKLSTEEAIKILEDMKVDIQVPKAAVTQIRRNIALDIAIDALMKCSEIPNSWASERKNGKWIWCTSSDHLKCSECGTRAPMYMDYADGDYQEWLSDFCPECGCEMKGFEEDE